MKTYEMLYVLDAGLTDEANEALVKKFEDVVASSGGKVVSTDKWGVKKLAYSINYKNDGFYVLMTFEAEGSVVKELDRVAGLTSEVLRRVITAKDQGKKNEQSIFDRKFNPRPRAYGNDVGHSALPLLHSG